MKVETDEVLAEIQGVEKTLKESYKKATGNLHKISQELHIGTTDFEEKLLDSLKKSKKDVQKDIQVVEAGVTKSKQLETHIERLESHKKALSEHMRKSESEGKVSQGSQDLYAQIEKELEQGRRLFESVNSKILNTSRSVKERSAQFAEETENKVRKFIEEKVLAILFQNKKEVQKVDLCFMIDATGSMSSYIAYARDTIVNIIEKIKNTYPEVEIRIAIVAYRDVGDAKRFENFPFTESVIKAKEFLSSLEATGGDDDAEDVNGAFRQAEKLSWKHPLKHTIHILDDPCHGKKMNGLNSGDYFPNGHPEDVDWSILINNLKERSINYLMLKIGSDSEFMFNKFKEIYDSNPNNVEAGLVFDMQNLTNSKDHLAELIVSHVSSSISESIRISSSKTHAQISNLGLQGKWDGVVLVDSVMIQPPEQRRS